MIKPTRMNESRQNSFNAMTSASCLVSGRTGKYFSNAGLRGKKVEATPPPILATPGGLRWDPCTSLTRCGLGCTPKCPVDTGLAELGTPHDFRDCRTVFPQGFHFLNHWERQYRLGTESNASRLGLVIPSCRRSRRISFSNSAIRAKIPITSLPVREVATRSPANHSPSQRAFTLKNSAARAAAL